MNKLEYYLGLNYPITITEIPAEDGGGFQATIPQLGNYAFRGDGDSIEEAVENLREVKKHLFEQYIAKDIQIPEPIEDESKDYSGRFVLRVPADLHRFLAAESKKNNATLNQYCNYLLTHRSLLNCIQENITCLRNDFDDISYIIQKLEYEIHETVPSKTSGSFETDINHYKLSA